MEVAPPLTYSYSTAGAKRGFCSTGLNESNPYDAPTMDLADDKIQLSFKRRRLATDTIMESSQEQAITPPPFNSSPSPGRSIVPANSGHSLKRCRIDSMSSRLHTSNANDLSRTLEAQASEISNLKNSKSNLETTLSVLKSGNEKVVHENKILKRAVTIQNERQQYAARDLDQARQYRTSALNEIKKLEHIILSLRYHLQTQQQYNTENAF